MLAHSSKDFQPIQQNPATKSFYSVTECTYLFSNDEKYTFSNPDSLKECKQSNLIGTSSFNFSFSLIVEIPFPTANKRCQRDNLCFQQLSNITSDLGRYGGTVKPHISQLQLQHCTAIHQRIKQPL